MPLPTTVAPHLETRFDEVQGHFIVSGKEVLDYGVGLGAGRVFADLWDLEKFSTCEYCFESRKVRMHSVNMSQFHLVP